LGNRIKEVRRESNHRRHHHHLGEKMQYHKISRFIAKENTVEQNGKVHFKYNGHGIKT